MERGIREECQEIIHAHAQAPPFRCRPFNEHPTFLTEEIADALRRERREKILRKEITSAMITVCQTTAVAPFRALFSKPQLTPFFHCLRSSRVPLHF